MTSRTGAVRVGGLLGVGVGLVVQLVGFLGGSVSPGPVTLVLCGAVTVLAVTVVARTDRAAWLAGRVVAVLLGLDLAGAVADRFGAWGPPGAPGVSWGSWASFVDYTALLLPGAGRDLVVGAAVAATVTEVVLATLLVSGWQRRRVGTAAAGLFAVYLVAMTFGLGSASVATYALPVLVGGALLVSIAPVRRAVRPRTTGVPAAQPSQVGGLL